MSKPIKCARCGRENDPSFTFCLDCGQSLSIAPPPAPGERLCPACGAKVLPTFRFCGHCGRPVDPAPSPAAADLASPAAEERLQPVPTPSAAPALFAQSRHAAKADPLPVASAVDPVAPVSEGKGYKLTVIRRDGQPGPAVALDKPEIVCGRAEGDLVLRDDLSVSPRHVQFTVREGTVWVNDLGSTNGTFVRLRAPRSLADGDEIRLGHQLLRLEPLPRSAGRPADPPDGSVPWGSPDKGQRLRLAQVMEGGGSGEAFTLKTGENTIGRESGDIHFSSDRFVSGRHARIDVSGGAATLTDLGSSNGTFVRISGPTALEPGDQLMVGIQLLRLE